MRKIFTLSLFLFLVSSSPSFAQTVTLPLPTTTLTPSPAPTVFSYDLPYPGILPGSPLYGLKAARDRLQEAMISDPLKKSNFYLLQADKRLGASILLFKQKDKDLGEQTLSKSINYLEKSVEKMIEVKKTQEDVLDIFGKVKMSSEKQKLEIERLLETSRGEEAEKLKRNLKRVEEIQNRVDSFKP